ncbi:hypothetical protein K9N68_20265 [Kovacikia minuta CCNUW1]|uniref:hypothetical protein n=1 Tax=Kovacikia minuta TaxID=2931930 RepID=UPI001CCECF3E|nr:hypothetical protein [Kovacikia minuta]UBF24053.1 hypothetical protein K9N68_20265 [Kovacikia minuta CCNUW1]
MTQSLNHEQTAQLQVCLDLAHDPKQHADARQTFAQLQNSLVDKSATIELLETLWNEVLAARRSAALWEQANNLEKELTKRMAEHHVQLNQNYLRLIQEQ